MSDERDDLAPETWMAEPHGGPFGAVMPPIYQTSTYIQDALGQPHNGYEYARTRNPTREALERALAALEGGSHGFAFASGLAALDTVLKLLKAGDHVVAGANLYGGSHRLMEQVFRPFGVAFDFIEMADASALEGALRPETRLVYVETPTNPMMQLTDLQSVADLCQARGLLLVVDNTFATPVLQRPLEFGDLAAQGSFREIGQHFGVSFTSRLDTE